MPIFMDRHDLRGAKPEDVAEAHRRDVAIQLRGKPIVRVSAEIWLRGASAA